MRFLLRAINAVLRAVMATIGGMSLFFFAIAFWVFIIPAVVVCALILGALLIVSCFALVFWLFTRDPNALWTFWMFSLMGAAPFGAFALVRHIFIEIARARRPKDAPFLEGPVPQVMLGIDSPSARAIGHVSPWMRRAD